MGSNYAKWTYPLLLSIAAILLLSCNTDNGNDPVTPATNTATVVVSATATSNTTVEITFDRDINGASIIDAGAQFEISNGLNAVSAVVAGPVVTLTTDSQTGGLAYTVTAHFTIQDTNGNPIDDANNAAVFSGFNALTVVSAAGAVSPTSVEVLFSRPVNPASIVANGSQFTIDNGLTVSAVASINMDRVVLTTSTQTAGVNYTVTADAMTIQDINTNPIDPTGNTASFTGHLGVNALVINEIDYDNPFTDNNEFVEVLNTSGSAIDLAGVKLSFVDGADGTTYRSVGLSGVLPPGGYLNVGNNSAPAADLFIYIGAASNAIQNGPDGIRLESSTQVLDSVAYEGAIVSNPATGEGNPTGSDSNITNISICRIPNGVDTDDNSVDFQSCAVTAGSLNTP